MQLGFVDRMYIFKRLVNLPYHLYRDTSVLLISLVVLDQCGHWL